MKNKQKFKGSRSSDPHPFPYHPQSSLQCHSELPLIFLHIISPLSTDLKETISLCISPLPREKQALPIRVIRAEEWKIFSKDTKFVLASYICFTPYAF